MYATLNNAMNIPEVRPGETADQYRDRIIDDAKTMFASQVREINLQQSRRTRASDTYIQEQRQALNDEADRIRSSLTSDVQSLQKRKKELEAEAETLNDHLDEYRKVVSELAAQMYEIRSSLDLEEERTEKASYYDRLQKGMAVIEVQDPERSKEFRFELDDILLQADRYEEVIGEQESEKEAQTELNIGN